MDINNNFVIQWGAGSNQQIYFPISFQTLARCTAVISGNTGSTASCITYDINTTSFKHVNVSPAGKNYYEYIHWIAVGY